MFVQDKLWIEKSMYNKTLYSTAYEAQNNNLHSKLSPMKIRRVKRQTNCN